jgi:hypothetical protein
VDLRAPSQKILGALALLAVAAVLVLGPLVNARTALAQDPLSMQGDPDLQTQNGAKTARDPEQAVDDACRGILAPGTPGLNPQCDDPQAGEDRYDSGEKASPAPVEDSSDDGGIMGGITDGILDAAKGWLLQEILGGMWDWLVDMTEKLADGVSEAAFALPPLGQEDGLVGHYNDMVDLVKPALVVGLLLLGLLMMVQSANYNTQYAVLHGLPKLGFVALCLAFFPQFMQMLSELSASIGDQLGSMTGSEGVGGALDSIMQDILDLPGAEVVFVANPQLPMLIAALLLIPTLVMLLLVLIISVVKNMLFGVLVISGPAALIAYPIPGLSGITGAWFRAVVACFFLPILFAIEMTVGTWLVKAPEILGSGDNVAMSAILLVVMLYVMVKTPFKVLEWAFQGTYSPGGGMLSQIAKGLIKKEAMHGLSKGMGAAAGKMGIGSKADTLTGKGGASMTTRERMNSHVGSRGQQHRQERNGPAGPLTARAEGEILAGQDSVALGNDADDIPNGAVDADSAADNPGTQGAADPADNAREILGVGRQEDREAGALGAVSSAPASQGAVSSALAAGAGSLSAGVPDATEERVGGAQSAALSAAKAALAHSGPVSLPGHERIAAAARAASGHSSRAREAAALGDFGYAREAHQKAAAGFGDLQAASREMAASLSAAGHAGLARLYDDAARRAGIAFAGSASEARAVQEAGQTLPAFGAGSGTGPEGMGLAAVGAGGFAATLMAETRAANEAAASASGSSAANPSIARHSEATMAALGRAGTAYGARNLGQAATALHEAGNSLHAMSNEHARMATSYEGSGHGAKAALHRKAQRAATQAGDDAHGRAAGLRGLVDARAQHHGRTPSPGGADFGIRVSKLHEVSRAARNAAGDAAGDVGAAARPSRLGDGRPFDGDPYASRRDGMPLGTPSDAESWRLDRVGDDSP